MPPVADIERRVGQHEVCTQVRVLIAGEGITVFAPEVVVHPLDGEVHRRQPPSGRVRLLTVDGDITQLAAMGFDKPLRLHEHAA